jgi:DMSO reductase anchor subunit
VQSCPNGAIRISVVDQAQAVEASEAGTFLPGAPAPEQTIPTTVYRSKRDLPRNLLPADFYTVSPEHAHLPLVVMLLLTQLSVGAFVVNLALGRLFAGTSLSAATALLQAMVALGFAAVALGAATLHLGRPQFAFRAVLGLRTSWMSREILAFGLFAKMAALYALTLIPALGALPFAGALPRVREGLAIAAATFGVAGVFCSAMIYAATRRAQWHGGPTGFRFCATTVILGAAAALAMATFLAPAGAGPTWRLLLEITCTATFAKLVFDGAALRHLAGRVHTVEKRVALLMVGDLRGVTVARFFGGAGGLALGVMLLLYGPVTPLAPVAMFALLLMGEGCERYLFFRAAPPSRMPGAPA